MLFFKRIMRYVVIRLGWVGMSFLMVVIGGVYLVGGLCLLVRVKLLIGCFVVLLV